MAEPSIHELDPTIMAEIARGADEPALDDMGHGVPEGIAETTIYVSRKDAQEELEELAGLEYLLDVAPGLTLTPAEQARFDRLSDIFDQQEARRILGFPPDIEILN